MNGAITDTSNAVVPSARVTVTNVHTGTQRVTSSETMGFYEVSLLEPGDYKSEAGRLGTGGGNDGKHDLAVGNSTVQTGHFRFGETGALLWGTRHRIFARIRPEVADECPFQSYGGLDDADIDELRL